MDGLAVQIYGSSGWTNYRIFYESCKMRIISKVTSDCDIEHTVNVIDYTSLI